MRMLRDRGLQRPAMDPRTLSESAQHFDSLPATWLRRMTACPAHLLAAASSAQNRLRMGRLGPGVACRLQASPANGRFRAPNFRLGGDGSKHWIHAALLDSTATAWPGRNFSLPSRASSMKRSSLRNPPTRHPDRRPGRIRRPHCGRHLVPRRRRRFLARSGVHASVAAASRAARDRHAPRHARHGLGSRRHHHQALARIPHPQSCTSAFARRRERQRKPVLRASSRSSLGPPEPLPHNLAPPPAANLRIPSLRRFNPRSLSSGKLAGGAAVLTSQSQCPSKHSPTARLGARGWEPGRVRSLATQRGQPASCGDARRLGGTTRGLRIAQ